MNPTSLALIATLIAAGSLAYYVLRQRRYVLDVRRYPVFAALAEEVGRSAEGGTLLHVALGRGDITGQDAITSMTAFLGLSGLLNMAAAYDTPPIITTGNPTLYLLADDMMRRSYARIGNVKRYRPTLVQYVAASPITYAAVSATQLYKAEGGSNIVLGVFDQEVSLLLDAGERHGVASLGGAVSPQAVAAMYPALSSDVLAIGEDFFSGSAAQMESPIYRASLWTQELLRWVLIAAMVLAGLGALVGLGGG